MISIISPPNETRLFYHRMGDLKRGKRKIGCCLLLPNWLAGGEHPARSVGDAGTVPLSLRETAKGGEQRTQLASLKQVSAVLQRSHPRAKRKPDPRIMHSCPDAHRRRRYCWHILRRDVSVDSDNRWAEVSLFLRVTCAYV